MANGSDLKRIALARLHTAKILIKAKDWEGAAYMLGYVLECSLKSCACKSLRLSVYPDDTKKTTSHFRTHNFDQLITLSGLTDIFGLGGIAYQNWSEFTQEYPAEWPAMRYNPNTANNFDEIKTKELLNNLIEKPHGILTVIKAKKRW